MPALNGTGPQGAGPMTGRGMGLCGNGQGMSQRFGFGRRRGTRRGLCRYFGGAKTWSKNDLQEYKKALQEEMEDVSKEIEAVDKRQE